MIEPKKVMATLEWTGGLRFSGGKPEATRMLLDADGVEGPSPITALVCAAGACSGADVVSILEKKRVKVTRFQIDVGGRRAEEYPRRFVELWLRFTLAGEGLTEVAARRAVELSVEKYCSVLLSLNPDIPITTEIVIE